MISLAIFLLAGRLFPPPPQPKPAVAEKDAKGQAAEKKAAAPADAQKKGDHAEVVNAKPAAAVGGLPAIAPSKAEDQFVAIGSLDPDSGYRMLVTLSNTGA